MIRVHIKARMSELVTTNNYAAFLLPKGMLQKHFAFLFQFFKFVICWIRKWHAIHLILNDLTMSVMSNLYYWLTHDIKLFKFLICWVSSFFYKVSTSYTWSFPVENQTKPNKPGISHRRWGLGDVMYKDLSSTTNLVGSMWQFMLNIMDYT